MGHNKCTNYFFIIILFLALLATRCKNISTNSNHTDWITVFDTLDIVFYKRIAKTKKGHDCYYYKYNWKGKDFELGDRYGQDDLVSIFVRKEGKLKEDSCCVIGNNLILSFYDFGHYSIEVFDLATLSVRRKYRLHGNYYFAFVDIDHESIVYHLNEYHNNYPEPSTEEAHFYKLDLNTNSFDTLTFQSDMKLSVLNLNEKDSTFEKVLKGFRID